MKYYFVDKEQNDYYVYDTYEKAVEIKQYFENSTDIFPLQEGSPLWERLYG